MRRRFRSLSRAADGEGLWRFRFFLSLPEHMLSAVTMPACDSATRASNSIFSAAITLAAVSSAFAAFATVTRDTAAPTAVASAAVASTAAASGTAVATCPGAPFDNGSRSRFARTAHGSRMRCSMSRYSVRRHTSTAKRRTAMLSQYGSSGLTIAASVLALK